MMKHALNRTSPKGSKFIGTCALCRKTDLTLDDMSDECENVRSLSQDEALIEIIKGVDDDR
jgi:hypothetical protein